MINCTYCFTSYVMYKKYKRLVYTLPDLLATICKVNLSNSEWFVFQEFVFEALSAALIKSHWLWSHLGFTLVKGFNRGKKKLYYSKTH